MWNVPDMTRAHMLRGSAGLVAGKLHPNNVHALVLTSDNRLVISNKNHFKFYLMNLSVLDLVIGTLLQGRKLEILNSARKEHLPAWIYLQMDCKLVHFSFIYLFI